MKKSTLEQLRNEYEIVNTHYYSFDDLLADIKIAKKAAKQRKIFAQVISVSRSGMSRKI